MQRATRRYARRQLVWFRRELAAEWRTVRGWDWVEGLAEQLAVSLAEQQSAAESRMPKVE